MVSTARVDGSLPDPGDNSTRGLIFSSEWGVSYDFAGNPASRAGQPRRLRDFGFPAPFDSDLEGALRGRGQFSQFLYAFKNGRYLRLVAATMTPDGPDAAADTAPAWGLPVDWTSFDAVLPGRGIKINFCYFFRGAEYIRFDWLQNQVSQGYPKLIGTEWHMTAPFDAVLDGVIVGQSGLTTKAFLFKILSLDVNDAGAVTAPGSSTHPVFTSGFARYDYTAEDSEGTVTSPPDVVSRWGGLLPLLDAGPAIDTAMDWCREAIDALDAPTTAIVSNALLHHFKTATPTPTQLEAIKLRFATILTRLASLPDRFQWTRNLPFPSQTSANTLTEIGDGFSTLHGPNGRAAVLIHEAMHFVFTGAVIVDVPEWSGETVNGRPFGISAPIDGVPVSGIAYSALTVDQAIDNPSSYAAFAQEIFFDGTDTRFGAARPQE